MSAGAGHETEGRLRDGTEDHTPSMLFCAMITQIHHMIAQVAPIRHTLTGMIVMLVTAQAPQIRHPFTIHRVVAVVVSAAAAAVLAVLAVLATLAVPAVEA